MRPDIHLPDMESGYKSCRANGSLIGLAGGNAMEMTCSLLDITHF